MKKQIPNSGEPWSSPEVVARFSGKPQCFLTEEQLIRELSEVGFEQEGENPLTEYPPSENGRRPSILEGIFRWFPS